MTIFQYCVTDSKSFSLNHDRSNNYESHTDSVLVFYFFLIVFPKVSMGTNLTNTIVKVSRSYHRTLKKAQYFCNRTGQQTGQNKCGQSVCLINNYTKRRTLPSKH